MQRRGQLSARLRTRRRCRRTLQCGKGACELGERCGLWAAARSARRTVDKRKWRGRVDARRRRTELFWVVHERGWVYTSERYTLMRKASARAGLGAVALRRSTSNHDARSRQLPTPTFRVRGVATAVRRCPPTPLLRAPALSPHAPSHAPPHTWCTRGAVQCTHHRVHTPSATCSSCMPSPGARRDAATAGRR